MVLPTQMLAVADEIIRCARKAVEHWGVTTVEDITAQVTEQLPEPVHSDLVTQILQGHQDFQWLDEAGGWFWLTSVSRNRLLNRINKVLSVSRRINVAELRAGVSRDHRMKGFVPPARVLLELCRQADGYLVEGSMASTASPVAWGDALGETEQILLLALGEHGPVMQRKELEELCIDLGMNRSTFSVYLGHSPIVARYAPRCLRTTRRSCGAGCGRVADCPAPEGQSAQGLWVDSRWAGLAGVPALGGNDL